MPAVQETIDRVKEIDIDQYKYGFSTDIEVEKAPKGLNQDIIRFISAKKDEPQWMLDWRLAAYERWLTMDEPDWARVNYPKIDFNDIYYYAAPKGQNGPMTIEDVDPEKKNYDTHLISWMFQYFANSEKLEVFSDFGAVITAAIIG